MYRIVLFLLLFCGSVWNAESQPRDARIDSLIDRIELESLVEYVSVLSGELPNVYISPSFLMTDRYYRENSPAATWLVTILRRLRLVTKLTTGIPNVQDVVATQTGTMYPDLYYIICAHYDTIPKAPGADDNASGTAAVLEVARVLSEIDLPFTVVYALWDAEEYGGGPEGGGARRYARTAPDGGANILGVINMDMIAWDGDGDRVAQIHTNTASLELAEIFATVNTRYEIGLDPVIINPGSPYSDHSAFWGIDRPAILLIEEFYGGDFNPYYHSPNDKLDRLDLDYFLRMTKLGAAAIAHLALGLDVEGVSVERDDPVLPSRIQVQSYPNPFTGEATFDLFNPVAGNVRLVIFDLLGREVAVVVDNYFSAGHHSYVWTPVAEPAGTLFYRVETDEYSRTGIMQYVR